MTGHIRRRARAVFPGRVTGGLLTAVCTAISPAAAQDMSDPPFAFPPGVELIRGLEYARYGPDRSLELDLFLPPSTAPAPRPAVVFIHGGGWTGGDRRHFHRQAAHLAGLGFVTACVEYRLAHEAPFPAALHDVKAAVRWLRGYAADYGIDPDAIGAAGGSAGGHLAALLALTPDIRSLEGDGGNPEQSSRIEAAVLFNPALDLARIDHPAPERFLGASFADDPEVWRLATPATHVRRGAPPVLILHGDSDSTVPYQHARDLVFLLRRVGGRARLFTASGAGHGFFNSPPWYGPTLREMTTFFQITLLGRRELSERHR